MVSAGGEVVDGGNVDAEVDAVVDLIPGDVVLDDRDEMRAWSDGVPALHAVPTRARLAIRAPSLSTRRCYVGNAWKHLAAPAALTAPGLSGPPAEMSLSQRAT